MHDLSHRQAAWRRKTQGQKKQGGNEARHGCKWTERSTSWAIGRQVSRNDTGPERKTYNRWKQMTHTREHDIQRFGKQLQEKSGVDEERAKIMEWGMTWAVEARKRRRDAEQEQRRQEEQMQRRQEEQGQNTRTGARQERKASAFRRERRNKGDVGGEHRRARGDG